MPLFRGTVFLKRAELSASIFQICAELWVLIEEACRIMELFGKVWQKLTRRAKDMQKLRNDFVAF